MADAHDRMEHVARLARQRGLSLTVQRRAVLEALLGRTDHPTADQLFDDIKRRVPGVARTTVYRVLETLVSIGAITRASSPGSAARYDPVTARHHHLHCLHCEALIDLDDSVVGRPIVLPRQYARSFEIHDYSIHFHGICAACRRKMQGLQRRSSPQRAAVPRTARGQAADTTSSRRQPTKARKSR